MAQTYLESDFEHDDELGIVVCINCGAHADSIHHIRHYEGCQPGDAAKWADCYEEEPTAEYVLCTNCSEPNDPEATHCRECGTEMPKATDDD